jgi:acetylornithine deacetylase
VDAVTRLLSELVAIPSVNPMGRSLSGPGFLEGRMSDYLEGWFGALGVPCERTTISPGRDNIVARYDAPGARRTVLFDAHQDTVPTDGMTIPPFTPEIREGRLYGRGSCDVKGSMAAMLTAFARLVRERPAGSASVIMACTVDEEFTHTGSSYLAEKLPKADYAIVAEPTRLDLVNRHKGAVRWKIRTRGTACHSSSPERGVNAIYRMGSVLSALSEYAATLRQSRPDPVLGPPSLSVGRIEGGVSVNVVPDWCEIEIDRRVIPGERTADCLEQVAAFLRQRVGDAVEWEFLPPWVNMPPLAQDPEKSSEWVESVRAAVAEATSRTPQLGGVPFGTDAGPLGEAGLPCLVFGPGDIAQAHTRDEWIEIDQVRAAVDAYFLIVRALG